MKKTQKIVYSVGSVVTATSVAAAIAIPLAIKSYAEKKATDIISQMIPLGGPLNSLAGKEKINYYSIGDSVAAGYNGYMALDSDLKLNVDAQGREVPDANKTDYLSYADFLANSLAKAGKLGDYRNFAKSGDKIPNSRLRIFRDPVALKALKKADLVTISLGANDLLSAVEFLKISFGTIMNMITGESLNFEKPIVEINNARDNIERIIEANGQVRADGQARDTSPSAYASRDDMARLVGESFDKLIASMKQGNLSGLVDMEQELLDKIFNVIQLDLGTMIAEIHSAAPDAKVVVMGYAFPFHLFPQDTILNVQLPGGKHLPGEQGPTTIRGVFNNFINTLKAMCDRANYVEFFDVNQLHEFQEGSDKVTYTLKGDANNRDRELEDVSEWDRVMPNALDIHPSTYGHQVIGGYLFQFIARDLMKLEVPDYQSVQKIANFDPMTSDLDNVYTYAGLDQGFDIRDETVKYYGKAQDVSRIFNFMNNKGLLAYLGHVLDSITNGKEVASLFKDYLSSVSIPELLMKLFPDGKDNHSKIGMGLISLLLYYGKKGTEIDPTKSTYNVIIPQLLKTLGASIKDQPIWVIAYKVLDVIATVYNNDACKYLTELVDLGKVIGFDISGKLPENWATDQEVALSVFRGGNPDDFIPATSYFQKALAKLDMGYNFNLNTRQQIVGEEEALDPAHGRYWIDSYSKVYTPGTTNPTGVKLTVVVDNYDAPYSLMADEIAKTITWANVFGLTDPSANYRNHIQIEFLDSRGNNRGKDMSFDLTVDRSTFTGATAIEDYKAAVQTVIKAQLAATLTTKPNNPEEVQWPEIK